MKMETRYCNMMETKRYGDLMGIMADLLSVSLCCLEIIKHKGNRKFLREDESHTVTAIIKYARCFNTGMRIKIDISKSQYTKKEIEYHDYFIAYRNKHLAHSVNPYEQNTVSLKISKKNGKNCITDIGGKNTMVVSINPHKAAVMHQMCKKVQMDISKKIVIS